MACARARRRLTSHERIAAWLALLAYPGLQASAAEFCVTHAVALQIALDAAAGNGVDDHIRVVAGTYLLTQGLDFESEQAQALRVSGGYTNGCASLGTSPTTISGQNLPAAPFDALLAIATTGAVTVEGLRLVASDSAALFVYSTAGDVTIDRLRVESNGCDFSGCINVDSGSGVIRFRGNLVVSNTSAIVPAVILGTDAGHIFASSNTIYGNLALPITGGEPDVAGLSVEAGRLDASRFTVLSNNILQNNTGSGTADLEARGVSFRLNNLVGAVIGDPASSVEAESSADADLCLALPCTAFYTPLAHSPAIDSGMDTPIGGSPGLDVYLNPRWRGLHPDRGAVEARGNLLRDGFEP